MVEGFKHAVFPIAKSELVQAFIKAREGLARTIPFNKFKQCRSRENKNFYFVLSISSLWDTSINTPSISFQELFVLTLICIIYHLVVPFSFL